MYCVLYCACCIKKSQANIENNKNMNTSLSPETLTSVIGLMS